MVTVLKKTKLPVIVTVVNKANINVISNNDCRKQGKHKTYQL